MIYTLSFSYINNILSSLIIMAIRKFRLSRSFSVDVHHHKHNIDNPCRTNQTLVANTPSTPKIHQGIAFFPSHLLVCNNQSFKVLCIDVHVVAVLPPPSSLPRWSTTQKYYKATSVSQLHLDYLHAAYQHSIVHFALHFLRLGHQAALAQRQN